MLMYPAQLKAHKAIFNALDMERRNWFSHWREVADNFLPRRYPWLLKQSEVRTADRRNNKLLDSTSTLAVRTLASGMMSGITSPARKWFRLRIAGFSEASMSDPAKLYLEEIQRRLMLLMAESNLYNGLSVLYLEWCTFGTAAMTIREDFNDVFRCYNHPLGEFYLGQDNAQRVNRFARRFEFTIEQAEKEFGLDKLSINVQNKFKQGGAALFETIEICHLIEEQADDGLLPGATSRWRELYWEATAPDASQYLKILPLYEWAAVTPRWELIGSDSYGVSPAMDCLSDVKELQQLKLERAQGLQKQVRPPLIVDMQMKNRPKALSAGGITYAALHNTNFGAKEAYKVNLPYGELRQDIEELKRSIRETCKNDLFNMISQLDTVRSATEIDARREEKLIHLGSVFDRFTTEGSDIILKRIFGIAQRAGLLPEAPPELDGLEIDVQYVSVLSDAQRASSTIAIERYFQLAGNLVGVWPEAKEILNVEELMREYSEGIGVSPKGNRSREDLAALKAQQDQMAQAAQMASIGNELASGAQTLSQTDVGGGVNALQALL